MSSVYRHSPSRSQTRPSTASSLDERHQPSTAAPSSHTNQPSPRGVAGLRSCPVTPTSSPLWPAVARMAGEGSVECGRPRRKEGWSRARRRMWWRSRVPVALYLEPAHPGPIAARSRVGADGVGVGSGAHLPPGPCAPMVAITIRRCIWACQRLYRPQKKSVLSLFFSE